MDLHEHCHSCKHNHYRHSCRYDPIVFGKNDQKTRSKRQVPIVQHGYKFVMNMLPPFIKEPIQNAVNIMALAHPEKQKKKAKFAMILPGHKNERKPSPMSLKQKIRAALKKQKGNVLLKSRMAFENDERNSEKIDPKIWIRELSARDILDKYPERKHKDSKYRSKRSIIMDSEELSVPLYQLKLADNYPAEDEEFLSREYVDIEEPILRKRKKYHFHHPREDLLRKAIKEELGKFKQIDYDEDQFRYKKMVPHTPLFHLLSMPMKFFRKFGGSKNSSPIMAVPKMIVGTKKYFKDFGKNFKKHALDFASDMIGDFDHEPYENHLKDVFKPSRFRRSISKTNELNQNTARDGKKQNDEVNKTIVKPENSAVFNDLEKKQMSDNQTHFFGKVFENKVRKKRYIVKVVDEDEVEEYLRKKLGKMFNIPQYLEEKHSEEESWTVEETNNFYKRRNKYEDDGLSLNKKINIEKVKPKLIIDNNGIPFMEMNGFKRPIFMKKFGNHYNEELVGNSQFMPIDSSEEVNKAKIDHIIGYARNNKKKEGKTIEVPINTIKKKMSDLLHETDVLVHIDFWKYHEIYDDLLEIQYIKASIVQDWKKIVMENRINDLKAKVNLLGKFKALQHIKDIAVQNIVEAMYRATSTSFILDEFVKMLIKLHKLQCVINKVVSCFEEKFKMGTKFDMQNEIKFVDFLAKLNFAGEKTRNDMINKLKEIRDSRLQENIKLLDKLKKSLIEEDEPCIEDEANLIWEIKNIEKMRKRTIEEMYQKLFDGYRIKKHMKILFDLTKRLQSCEKELKEECKNDDTVNSKHEDEEKISKKTIVKKFNVEEFKQKLQEKMEKRKELLQERKEKLKKKYKKESDENE